MNYHNLTYPDQNNGDGLRVVLWLSGCCHHCKGCQNPQTWDYRNGIIFDESAKQELFRELNKNYISGITLSGGDPLYDKNVNEVLELIDNIRLCYPNKTIWLYSGYTWEEIFHNNSGYTSIDQFGLLRQKIVKQCDVLVDGRYIDSKRDITLHWCGSSNQRVIDVQATLKKGEIVLWQT